MEGFKLSQDCMIEKSSKAIAKELLSGDFVIGCDYKDKVMVLENVFHYTESQKRFEIYKLFPDYTNTRRQLKLDFAVVLKPNCDVVKTLEGILQMATAEYDLFISDKHNNLYTKIVYDKYGKSMKLA